LTKQRCSDDDNRYQIRAKHPGNALNDSNEIFQRVRNTQMKRQSINSIMVTCLIALLCGSLQRARSQDTYFYPVAGIEAEPPEGGSLYPLLNLIQGPDFGFDSLSPFDQLDNLVNAVDINQWVKDLFVSWVGDADLNGEFNSSDLVTVLASGTYETDLDSVWSTGDFNGDGRTTSGDLVAALADGGYEAGPRAAGGGSARTRRSVGCCSAGYCWSHRVGRLVRSPDSGRLTPESWIAGRLVDGIPAQLVIDTRVVRRAVPTFTGSPRSQTIIRFPQTCNGGTACFMNHPKGTDGRHENSQ
jgi:hypothetical protein